MAADAVAGTRSNQPSPRMAGCRPDALRRLHEAAHDPRPGSDQGGDRDSTPEQSPCDLGVDTVGCGPQESQGCGRDHAGHLDEPLGVVAALHENDGHGGGAEGESDRQSRRRRDHAHGRARDRELSGDRDEVLGGHDEEDRSDDPREDGEARLVGVRPGDLERDAECDGEGAGYADDAGEHEAERELPAGHGERREASRLQCGAQPRAQRCHDGAQRDRRGDDDECRAVVGAIDLHLTREQDEGRADASRQDEHE